MQLDQQVLLVVQSKLDVLLIASDAVSILKVYSDGSVSMFIRVDKGSTTCYIIAVTCGFCTS